MKTRHSLVALALALGALTLLLLLSLMDSVTASASLASVENPLERPLARAAVVRYVATAGSDSGDCSAPGDPCRTIQYAVDRAGAGDEIRVAAGAYADVNAYAGLRQVLYLSKTLTVRGGYTTTDWSTSNPISYPTVLNAQGGGRVLYVTGHVSPTLEGLHITRGDPKGLGGSFGVIGAGADAGGGLYVITATITLHNNQLFSNTAHHGGGAFFYYSPDATLSHNVILSNTTDNLAGGLYFRHSPGAMLTANTIRDNDSRGDGGQQHYGGARFDHSANATLVGNTIRGNHADNQCGGICFTSSGNATLIGNDIVGNSAGKFGHFNSAGGGLSFITSADARLIGNTISGNSSRTFGGGLYLERSNVTLINNVLVGNRIAANSVLTGSGSALYSAGSSPRLLHTTLARNGGGDGSGVYVKDVFNTFSSVAMTNTILVDHAVGITATKSNTVTLNGVLWYSNTTNYGGEGHFTVSNAHTGDPAFDGDGYHLTAASAAIDRGVNSGVDEDIDGDPRPTILFDLGADEYYHPALKVTKQADPDSVPAGSPLTYTIRVTNTGNVTLNATVTDILPYWVTPTGTLTWNPIITAPGGVWSTQVVVTPRLCYSGTLSNLVRVTTPEGASGVYTESSSVVFAGHCLYLPLVSKDFPPFIQMPEGEYQFVEYWTHRVLGAGCSPLCIDFPTYSFYPHSGELVIYYASHTSPTLALDDDDIGYFGSGTSLGGVGCGASSDLTRVGSYPFSQDGITLRYVDATGTLTLDREGELIVLGADEAWTSAAEIEIWDPFDADCVVTKTQRITNYAFEDRDKIVFRP
jgi:uncharacterized repeat protein (TIGR01451 family)